MPDFIIRYDKKACIGAGVCEAFSEKDWSVKEDKKAVLINAEDKGDNIFEKIIQEEDLAVNKQAAEGCPPKCIKIFNKETGEEIELDI